MNEIRHGVDGWDLVEFSRQMPNGKNAQVIEKFVYELHHRKDPSRIVATAVGYRVEGESEIVFQFN